LLNFSDRPLFEAPVLGNSLEFGDEIWRCKTTVLGLPASEEIMMLYSFLRFDTIPARDRQTDGRTDRHVEITMKSLIIIVNFNRNINRLHDLLV